MDVETIEHITQVIAGGGGPGSAGDELDVDVESLINFFDVDEEAQPHASSIKAVIGEEFLVGCMIEYFRERGETAKLVMQHDNKARLACTTGERKGFQLDGLFEVAHAAGTTCYQMEIKAWSFHGIASKGRRREIEEGEESAEALALKKETFEGYYDAKTCVFCQPGVRKVMLAMKVRKAPKRLPAYPVPSMPLLCIWEAVAPQDATKSVPWFVVKLDENFPGEYKDGELLSGGGFGQAAVFSASVYLRDKLAAARAPGQDNARPTIRMRLPQIAARLRLLQGLFSWPAAEK